MDLWTPYGKQQVRAFNVLVVKLKTTGEEVEIKDFRFNPALHEVIGEKSKVLTTDEKILSVKNEFAQELEVKTRKELEAFGLEKGFTPEEMKVCLNKKSLVELLVSR